MDLVQEFLGNWILVLWVAFYITLRYVIPGLAVGWLVWRIGRWLVDRVLWVLWFNKN